MTLPILTTTEDVRAIVRYLKAKPTGAVMSEARAALKKEVLDPRKISAFRAWGFVEREGERLKLTELGWELARKPEAEAAVFRAVLSTMAPYRSALEWAHHQGFDAITNVEVAAQWHQHHRSAVGSNEETIKYMAVCFFHVCQGARLGRFTIGRRGQPTRLVLDRAELATYIEAGPGAPPWTEAEVAEKTREETTGTPGAPAVPPIPAAASEKIRVFISHGKNAHVVEQVRTMLALGDMESVIAEKEETTAIPVPEKVFSAMRRCHAAIIAVTAEEAKKDDGKYALNENVLIEIGAAFVLYDKRVVLLWDKRLPVPSNLQGLYRCDFEGDELSWSAGMRLMEAIRKFKQ